MKDSIVSQNLFRYPERLRQIFNILAKNGARPIIVGGFVRDALLGIQERKDIDIEVYGIDSYDTLTKLLAPFGSVCLVGKSFGVCKLKIGEVECDFSLPRKETKIACGHKGFAVQTDASLSFKEASARRDFTINALGYDPIAAVLLDEYGGVSDLKNKTLRAVNTETFKEDPLRVLRGVVFAARFSFHFHPTLTTLCKEMIKNDMLAELPKERVFEELKKLFEKSKKPSRAFLLLKRLGENLYFDELFSLQKEKFKRTLVALDSLACKNEKELALFFASMLVFLSSPEDILQRFTNDKKLLRKTLDLITNHKLLLQMLKNGYNEVQLKLAAAKMQIEPVLRFIEALYPEMRHSVEIMRKEAQKLGILYEPLPPVVTGKRLQEAGFAPSKEFKKILDELYLLQLQGEEINDKYLHEYLTKKGYL